MAVAPGASVTCLFRVGYALSRAVHAHAARGAHVLCAPLCAPVFDDVPPFSICRESKKVIC